MLTIFFLFYISIFKKIREKHNKQPKMKIIENTVIGFYVNNENTIKQCNDFWKYYINCPTYRYQPLWNFIYLKNNIIPYIDNNFRSYFDGIKKIERHINEYNQANNI